jgi:hypothetical protein
MALKGKYAKKEDIPSGLENHYEANGDGSWHLQVEGMVPKAQLDEFRNNNIDLTKKLEKFKDVDVDKYKELINRSEDDFKKAVLAATAKLTEEQVEAAVTTRVKKMQLDHEAEAKALKDANTNMSSLLSVAMIDNAVRAEAIKAGVQDTAVDDVVLRARTTFKLVDTSVVAFNPKGEKLFDKDGQTPLPVSTWVVDLKKTAPHLFRGMEGGGAGGGRGAGGAPDVSKMSPTQKIAAGLASS